MITPSQFKALRGSRLAAIEQRIDESIAVAAAARDSVVHIAVCVFDAPQDEILAVLRDYRATGWKAELVRDERDGNYVRLEAV